MTNLLDRYQGSLLGLAIGDALGAPIEFKMRDRYEHVTDMITGNYTDDTSLALCLAKSLIETGSFSPRDQMDRYVRWFMTGYMSSTGRCLGIGQTTLRALMRYMRTKEPLAESYSRKAAGNGSLMRIAPIPLACFPSISEENTARMAGESSLTTHAHPEAVDSCKYYARLIYRALRGDNKDSILAGYAGLLQANVQSIAEGGYKTKTRDQIQSSGYVIHTLEAALWAFWNTDSFKEGALLAVNLGHDADTIGAVYGQLAGAYYGKSAIPSGWLELLAKGEEIEEIAATLMNLEIVE